MSSKKKVLRGGQKVLGTLSSGAGDDILTRDTTTKEVGLVPAIDSSVYLSTSLLNGRIFVGNSSNLAIGVTPTGVILLDNTGLFSIAPDVITNENIFSGAAIDYSKLNLANSIVNNDIAINANIDRTKIVSGNPYRILINDSTGGFTEQIAITPNRVLISNANGLPIDSSLTTTILSYIDPTSSIQNQLNNRLTFSSTIIPAEGDLVVFQSGIWNRFSKGTSGQYLTSTVGGLSWTTTPNGLPTGGAANEILRKIDTVDYNTEWHTLSISDLTDITANATQINVLATGFYDATSSIQTQFGFKLNNSLANNALFIGNSANQAGQLSPGTNGQVLTIVAGVPQWQTISGTGTVTSVAFSGGSTGLTVTGSPITTSGTITLTGTLGIANGGTNITSYTTGDTIYASSSSVLSKLGIGTNGYVLTVSGGLPSWQPNIATSPLTTKGDIYIYSTTDDRLPVGTDGYHLTADSTDPTGLKWTSPTFNPFSDLNPLVMDNSDNTKLARFEASGITTATTRTYILPDVDGTIALLGSANGTALSRVDDTNVTLSLSAGSNTALLNATTITIGWTGTLADGRITSSSNWNTAYNRSGTSLGFTSSTFTFTKQDTSTLTVAVPTFNQNTTGSAAKWTTARNLAGNSVDGSADIAFTNKFIVQGTIDSGLSNAQFLGALATGIVKNTTTTGVLSIAVAGDFPTLNQNTTGSAATLTTTRNIAITGDGAWNVNFNGSTDVTAALTLSTVNSDVGTFGSVTKSVTITVNGKGLITAISEQTVTPAVGSITGLGTGVATFLTTPSSANLLAAITDETGTGALVFAGSPIFTGTPTLGTLGYSDTGILWSWQSSTNSYNQVVIQNTSNGSAASTSYIVSNDSGTSSTKYGEFGMNSSGFTGSGSFNLANAVYLDAVSDDLVIGTVANKSIHFVTNNSTTDAISISGAGITTLNNQLKIVGAGAVPSLNITGVGTGTNYGVRVFQSDGTTEVFSIKDNGTVSFFNWTLPSATTINGTSTNTLKSIFTSLGTTQTDGAGLWLQNSTAAAAGAQQVSPSLVFEGQGWKTGGTPASQTMKYFIDLLPVQASTNPNSTLRFASSTNGAAYTTRFTMSDQGTLAATTVLGQLSFNFASISTTTGFGKNNSGQGIMTVLSSAGDGFAISGSIGTTITSRFQVSNVAQATNGLPIASFLDANNTTMNAESNRFYLSNASGHTWQSGTYANQRFVYFTQNTVAQSGGTATFTRASSFSVQGAVISNGASSPITTSIGFEIESVNVGANTTSSYGIIANAMTGATNNYAAYFNGSVGIGLSAPLSTLDISGSFGSKTSSVSTNTTLDSTYFAVRVDASGANRTITLPSASGCTGRIYVILKSDSSANTVTISTTAGGDKTINTQYSGYMVQSNGTAYNVISSF